MSTTPTAPERPPCPPGFSLRIMMSHARRGSRSPASSSSASGAASSRRGSTRRRRVSPALWPPLELNPEPTSGSPSRTTSLTIATIEQSIELKSIHALRIEELIGTTPSCTDWIFIAVPPAVDQEGTQQLGSPLYLRHGEAVYVDHDDVRAVVAEARQGR